MSIRTAVPELPWDLREHVYCKKCDRRCTSGNGVSQQLAQAIREGKAVAPCSWCEDGE